MLQFHVSLVDRPRLRTRLENHRGKVVLVSAPAGFGKTALVAEWARRQPLPVAWLSLDRFDNDPVRFFRHLSATLGDPDVASADEAVAALHDLDGKLLLVLDDAHEIDDPSVLHVIERMLDARTRGPRVVVIARVDPPIALSRMRLSGDMLEIRENDLRFDADESASLFGDTLDRALVEILAEKTEGWAAGLRMAAIVLQNSSDPAAAVSSFAGSNRLVVDYLLEEAIDRQPPEIQRFLLDTSVLHAFTAETCAHVTGLPHAVQHLEFIEKKSLFIVALDSGRIWFRYHHLFRELLEFRLQRSDPERHQALHARAADWFENHGDIHRAVEHACELTDPAKLVHLLDRHAMSIIARSELATIDRWMRRVPSALTQPYPMLIVAIAWVRILTERAPDLNALVQAGEDALANVPSDYPHEHAERARLQLAVLQGFAARFAGRLEEALLITGSVQPDVPRDEYFIRGLVTYNLARLYMLFAEMQRAAQLFDEAFDENLRSDTLYLMLTGLGQRATIAAQMKGVQRARERLHIAASLAEQRHLTALPACSALHYHHSATAYLADELDHAHAAACRAIEVSGTGFPEGHANGLLLLFRIALAGADFAKARALLTDLEALAQNQNIVLMDSTVELERFRLSIAEFDAAGTAIQAPPSLPDLPTRWTIVRETERILALHHALRCERYDVAAAVAKELQQQSESRGRGVAYCVGVLGQALIPDEAHRCALLDRALCFSKEYGYARPLLDFGPYLAAALSSALTRSVSADARLQACMLLDRLRQPRRLDPTHTATDTGLVEPLTAREEQVLRMLFEDLSNKAIARRMFVSPETVKTHLKHLYGKLGAGSRQEALTRARSLGLPR